jgi:pilus assembly protein CpaC
MMTRTRTRLTMLLACLMLAVCAVSAPVALAAKEDPDSLNAKKSNSDTLFVTLGKAEIYTFKAPVADILVADPRIADVMALQTDKLFIVGAQLGDTNLIAMDEEGNVVRRLNIHVRIDTVALQSLIRELFPNERDVQMRTVGQQLILSGQVANPSVAQKISNVVASHISDVRGGSGSNANPNDVIKNLLEVRGEQQVTLRVRIVEMSRDVIRQLGVQTNVNAPDALGNDVTDVGGSLTGRTNSGTSNFSNAALLTGSLILDSGITGIGFIEFLIDALEEENLANVLAEPNLTALSGEDAGFLAGGEFPVPVGRDNDGNVIIDFREFGVSLNFKPLVMNDDRISLQMQTEVSSLDFQQGVTLEDTEIPGLDVRRASTTVELGSGSSLMIAGLLKSEAVKGMAGLPGIRNTPIIGDLVSSRSFDREETELVVIVTPYLVKPFVDTKQADLAPQPVDGNTAPGAVNPMAQAFVSNLQRNFGNKAGGSNIPSSSEKFGYMIE